MSGEVSDDFNFTTKKDIFDVLEELEIECEISYQIPNIVPVPPSFMIVPKEGSTMDQLVIELQEAKLELLVHTNSILLVEGSDSSVWTHGKIVKDNSQLKAQ